MTENQTALTTPLADKCINGMTQLQVLIKNLDHMIEKSEAVIALQGEDYARLVFARNTLAVNAKFWSEDTATRVDRTRSLMPYAALTGEDARLFHRRLTESFLFSMNEIGTLKLPGTAAMPAMINNVSQAFGSYITRNAETLEQLVHKGATIEPLQIQVARTLAKPEQQKQAA